MKLEPWEPHARVPSYVGDVEVHTYEDALHVVVFDIASAREPEPPKAFRMRFVNPAAVLVRDQRLCEDEIAEIEKHLAGYQLLQLFDSPLLSQFDDPRVTLLHYRIQSDGGDLVDVIAREPPTAEWD